MLYNKSSLDGLQEIKDNSVSLVFTSPPYPKGMRDYDQDCCVEADGYKEWLRPFLEACPRILHPTGSVVLVLMDKIQNGEIHPYIDEIKSEMRKLGLKMIDDIIWAKTNSLPNVDYTRRPNRTYEHCLWFVKDVKLYNWNGNAVRKPYAPTTLSRYGTVGRIETLHKRSGGSAGQTWTDVEPNPLGAACGNVLSGSRYSGRHPGHPAKFPDYLPTWFISGMTNPQDVVLDPFMGSGTTLVVAKQMDRRYIGYELSPVYYENALQNIEHAYTQIEIE